MVDEDVSRRTIAVYVKTGKLTARALAYALGAVGRKIAKDHRKAQAPQGKQSARQLMRHGGDTSGMDLPGDPRKFDRVARRWGVDYAIRPVEKGKYLLLFKAKQADAITGCFAEYSRRVLNRGKDRRPPSANSSNGRRSGCASSPIGNATGNVTRRQRLRIGNIRKYILPNLPYLFIGWAILKVGTAYRLAAGADLPHKLIGTMQTIGPAFADFAPGLALFDWLVGIVGAAAFRLLIYCKAKKAKKYRPDAEYGSARWGTPKDMAPFTNSKFESNVILTGTEFLTMNTRPKIPGNARNLNCCVIGSSGSGKTRFWLTPNLLQAHSSFVVVDPKGGVLSQVGSFLQKRGYRIKVFNSIDFSKSMHYNPLAYIRNEADILKFVDALIGNTKGEGKESDPFWEKSERLLYCALIAYIIFEGPAEDRNINTLVDMISGMEVKEEDDDFMNAVDYMFAGLEKRKPDCFAVKQYKKYKLASGVICSKQLLNHDFSHG